MKPTRNSFGAARFSSFASNSVAAARKPSQSQLGLCRLLTLSALTLLVSQNAQAGGTTRTWDGSSDANWSNTANWSGNTLPSANNDTASFTGTFGVGGTAISLNGNQNTGTLTISTTTNFSLNNNILTLATGDITRSATTGTTTINSGIALGAAGSWNIAGSSTAGSLIVNGIMDDGAGTFALDKSGNGSLTLSGNNTFGGGLTLSAGTLVLGHDSAAGSGTLTLANGTTINATGGTRTIANNLSIGGNLTFSGTDQLIFTDAFDQGGNRTYTVDNTTEFSGSINGSDNLIKSGTGTLILSGDNSLGTTIDTVTVNAGGALRVAHNGALGETVNFGTVVASGGALELIGGRTIGAEDLTLNGTGVSNGGGLRNISGTNSWAGLITINSATRINSDAGLLTLDVASGNAITGSNDALTFGGAGDTTVADAINIGTGTLNKDGAGTLTLGVANTYSGATNLAGGTLKISAANNLGTSPTITFDNTSLLYATVGGITLSQNLTFNVGGGNFQVDSGTLILNGTTITNGPGGGGLHTYGNGIVELQSANAASGQTIINTGSTLRLAGSAGSFSSPNFTVFSGGTLDLNGKTMTGTSSNFDLTGTGVGSNGALINSSGTTAAFNISGGVTLTGNASIGGAGDMTVAPSISGVGKNLTKVGVGTVALQNTNSYSGDTIIKGGILALTGAGSIDNSPNIIVGDAGSSGAVLDTLAKSGGFTISNTQTLSGIGTIKGAMNVQGDLNPGNSSGILSVLGDVNLQSSSNFNVELNGVTVGTGYDQLNVAGTFTLTGLASLNVALGYTPANGDMFFIVANNLSDPVSGVFNNAPVNGQTYNLGGQNFQISYFGNFEAATPTFTGGNDIVLLAVPEPTSMLLGSVGLGSLLLRRRRAGSRPI